MFHIYGLNAGLGLAVRQGATSVLAERFEPVETLALLARHRVTVVVGAPPMYVAWSMLPDAEEAFATVRLAISGAAPLPPTVLTRMIEATGHHVFEGYGLTETAPILTTTLMSEAAKPGSIGRPLPGVELRLDNVGGGLAAGAGEDSDDISGEVGVITVRGDNLFTGYWPDGSGGPDAEGWWSTGDVAFADDDGDLHLVDRARELILVSGFNVYPREVEDVLDAHPQVLETAVLGIPHPYTGESVKALVVLAPGASVTPAELIAWAARSLARFKCPTAVQIVDALPHTSTGKVSKGRLRELAGEPG
jgi:long-chain acyl-CoA synthetase